MFTKRKLRKEALEKLKKLIKEANGPLNPIKHAYKQQQLLAELTTLVVELLERKI